MFSSKKTFGTEADFLIVGEIGRGRTALINRALDRRSNLEVVIKTLRRRYWNCKASVVQFKNEATITVGISHPGIVRVLGEIKGHAPAFAMEKFIAAKTLEEWQNEFRTPMVCQLFSVAKQMFSTLSVIHRHGVIHRDLCPSNVLIQHATGRIKIIDFGFSKRQSDLDMLPPSIIVGSKTYNSPEIEEFGIQRASTSSDIWSVGKIIQQMFERRHQCGTKMEKEIGLGFLLQRCLDKNIAQRITSEQARNLLLKLE